MTVLVNGAPATGVSALDRGLHFGEGVFETIACSAAARGSCLCISNGSNSACARLGIKPPNLDEITAEVLGLASVLSARLSKSW